MSDVTTKSKCLIDYSSDSKKGGWNYRIMKRKVGKEEVYSIYEVYYDDVSNDSTITNFTESPVVIEAESFKNIKNMILSLSLMSDANCVLDYDKLLIKLNKKKNSRRKRSN